MTNPLVDTHFLCAADPWHESENPTGYVHLGTAEHHLLWDIVGPAIHDFQLSELDAHYVELFGTPACRQAIADFHGHMDPDRMALASGTSAILDILASCLFEPGDGILVPAPYYSGFVTCLTTRAGLEIIPVQCSEENGFQPTVADLETALSGSEIVRGIILCDPHNPSGRRLDAPERDRIVSWAATNNLEIIADEIYHHSVHSDGAHHSILETHPASPHVHVVYGLAKDAGLSGFKVGALHTPNPDVLAMARDRAYLAPVSSQTQATVATILRKIGKQIQTEGPARLSLAYGHLTTTLDAAGIKYFPAEAGVFAMLDLRKHLSENTWDAEQQLFERLFAAKVNLSPGANFHGDEPGWFRICFADDPAKISEGIRRMASVLNR